MGDKLGRLEWLKKELGRYCPIATRDKDEWIPDRCRCKICGRKTRNVALGLCTPCAMRQ